MSAPFRRLAIGVALLAAFALAMSAVPEAPAQTPAGSVPERIVSVGGAVTEIVHALGFADRIVAVDTTSVWPPETGRLPKVGYMRQLAAEPILALAPSLILAIEDSGPPAVLDQLRETGVPLVIVPDDHTPEGVFAKVAIIGDALGAPQRAQALAARVRSEIDEAETLVARAESKPRVLFLLTVSSSGTRLAAGRDTSADGIIALAGGRNAVTGFEGFKPLSPEAMVAAAPDIVIAPTRSLELLGGIDGVLAIPEIAATPAGKARRIVAIDAPLMLGFGPRTGEAVKRLAAQLHPELAGVAGAGR
jgi:iron complex transport system substrate-binding protein